jgi:hypothetical protein
MLSTKSILRKVLEKVWNGEKPSIFELKIMLIITSLQKQNNSWIIG